MGFFSISAAQLTTILFGLITLALAAYNQMSPKALSDKLKALEDLGERLPERDRSWDPSKNEPQLIDRYIERYTDIRSRADWAVAAGWTKRVQIVGLVAIPVISGSVLAAVWLDHLDGWYAFLPYLAILTIVAALSFGLMHLVVNRTMRKNGLAFPDKEEERKRFLEKIDGHILEVEPDRREIANDEETGRKGSENQLAPAPNDDDGEVGQVQD